MSFRSIILIIITAILLASCNPYAAELDSQLGKAKRVIEMHNGEPQYIKQDINNGTIYIYTFDGFFTEKRFYFNSDGICYYISAR